MGRQVGVVRVLFERQSEVPCVMGVQVHAVISFVTFEETSFEVVVGFCFLEDGRSEVLEFDFFLLFLVLQPFVNASDIYFVDVVESEGQTLEFLG